MGKNLDVGDRAPDFSATTNDGRSVHLEDFQGKYLVLYFYPKSFTPGCTKQAIRFRDNYPELRALGAEVLGVSIDSFKTQCDFAAKHKVTFPLLGDEDRTISKSYGVMRSILGVAKRKTFVIDPAGQIAAIFHHEFQVNKHLDSVVHFLKERDRKSA